MGISADDFWARSENGKAMVRMLAQKGHVETVRDVCDWLVVQFGKDCAAGAVGRGATLDQANALGENAAAPLHVAVKNVSDRNCEQAASNIIDAVFQRHYNAGKGQYDRVMKLFAIELRKRVKDDPT